MPGQLSGRGSAHGSGTLESSFFLVSGRRRAAFFKKSFPLGSGLSTRLLRPAPMGFVMRYSWADLQPWVSASIRAFRT